MRSEFDFSRALEVDVAIAGAGLAGLVAGAILAKHGRRVVVVDGTQRVGGRGGATPHRGFWLDGGQRDGCDVGDLQVGWCYGQLAEREADVELPLRDVEPVVRVHRLPETPGQGSASVSEGRWGASGFLALAQDAFGCPADRLPAFARALGQLAGASPEQRRAAVPLTLAEWTQREGVDPAVRRALLTMVTVIYCERPERASAGRLMGLLARPEGLPKQRTVYPDHPEFGGMQGLMEPWRCAIEARGGRVLLGLEPALVDFEGRRAVGLVARDPSHLVLQVRARDVVLARPLWEALPLLPSVRVEPELARLARALEDAQADAVAWQAGLSRLPRLRSSGEPESHIGWNRVLIGPERRYSGGFHLPSLGSRAAAPRGRHLLHAFIARWLAKHERPGWEASRAAIDRLAAHLREFYVDLDDCIEWSGLQLIARPACLAWFWSPLLRHGVRVPGCERLWIASTSFESDAGPVDIGAHAGLEAAREILGG